MDDKWFELFDHDRMDVDDEAEPELHGAPAALLRRLRELVPVWKALGLGPLDTEAGWLRIRLWVTVMLPDRWVARIDVTEYN